MGNKWRCPVAPSNENSAVRELCDRQLGACMVHLGSYGSKGRRFGRCYLPHVTGVGCFSVGPDSSEDDSVTVICSGITRPFRPSFRHRRRDAESLGGWIKNFGAVKVGGLSGSRRIGSAHEKYSTIRQSGAGATPTAGVE